MKHYPGGGLVIECVWVCSLFEFKFRSKSASHVLPIFPVSLQRRTGVALEWEGLQGSGCVTHWGSTQRVPARLEPLSRQVDPSRSHQPYRSLTVLAYFIWTLKLGEAPSQLLSCTSSVASASHIPHLRGRLLGERVWVDSTCTGAF